MISEGSYPISCPEECLKRSASISDTISPSSDLETDIFNEMDGCDSQKQKSEEKSLEVTFEKSEKRLYEEKEREASYVFEEGQKKSKRTDACLYMSNPTYGNATPVFTERFDMMTNNYELEDFPSQNPSQLKNKQKEEEEEPNNDLMMERMKELESPSLSESIISDKDEGRETRVDQITLQRITEVKNSLTLDLPTAQTNHCFSLTYSTDN